MLTANRTSIFTLAFTALLGVSSTGCGSVYSGEHSDTVHFLVEPANGSFSGWSAIDLGTNINQIGSASLWGISLSVESPPEADLSFLSSVDAQASSTTVATLSSFPAGEQNASMNITYYQNLVPLFEDSSTIRIDWSGSLNPAFTAWPSGGIWVDADITINVQ